MKKFVSLLIALAIVLCIAVPSFAADLGQAQNQAEQLKIMGLFKGVSDNDFALDRAPTRSEAMVMLIRLMGKEDEALSGNWSHPFKDVQTYADKYVGYAYEKGLTKGISKTTFGSKDIVKANEFLTLVLRALGYNDTAGDFTWNNPGALAKQVGILADDVDTTNFLRADSVLISYAALNAKMKDSTQTLQENLNIPLLSNYIGTYKLVEATADGTKYTNSKEMLYLHINGSLAIYADTDKDSEYQWVYGTWSIKNGDIIYNANTFGQGTGKLDGNSLTVKTENWEGLYQKVDADSTLTNFVGAYKLEKENADGKEIANNQYMLFLHEDGTLVYTIIKDTGYNWNAGTWNVKDGAINMADYWGPAKLIINGDKLTWNYSWKGNYQKIAAKDELKDYVGAYKLEKGKVNGAEYEVTGEVMYLHEDGTMAYTINEGSEYKWIYGTWGVKDGIISCADKVYGPSEGKFAGDSFTLKEPTWEGYYKKLSPHSTLTDYMGSYKLDKQTTDGIESEGTVEILYLHGDGTMVDVINDDYATCNWIVKDGLIYTDDNSYGYGKIDGNTFTWDENWIGYYQKVTLK
jgi:hypothetical protein